MESLTAPGIVAIIAGMYWLLSWYVSVERVKELKRLTIITNSGNAFPIVFNDEDFLDEVVAVMTDIIRDPAHAQDITINIKECTFSDDSSVIKNMYKKGEQDDKYNNKR